jgi:hypothetical protein
MWTTTWQAVLSGHTAADRVHVAQVFRRCPVTCGCRSPVPFLCRRVVWRRHAPPLVEANPEVVRRHRQPGLCAGADTRPLLSSTSRF